MHFSPIWLQQDRIVSVHVVTRSIPFVLAKDLVSDWFHLFQR